MSKIAFIFPGQGAQYTGMGRDFYEQIPVSRDVFAAASEASGLDIAALCFEENEKINITEYTQIGMLTVEAAILQALLAEGRTPDVAAGLSLGEYGALLASGVMEQRDAFTLVRKRGIYMQEAVPVGGAMAAVLGLDAEKIEEICKQEAGMVSIANYNCPGQIVITGEEAAVAAAGEQCKESGAKRVVPLKVSGPFHSPMLKEAGEKLGEALAAVTLREIKLPYLANVTADYVRETEAVKPLLKQQVCAPVRWQQSVERLLADGVDTFVEIGSNVGVSPYHLASRCKQEQGVRGTSDLISGRYSNYAGYYNYFNVRAFTTGSASAIVNGLEYAKLQGWNSIYKSIAGGSSVVADNYVKKGQNTIYFEKFNVVYTNSLYAHQYMTNVQAAMSEGTNMGKAYTDKNQAFVFRIPVYQNMPESAVTFADKGNPNNWLSSITVDGYALTPAFSGANTSYSLVVPDSAASINVGATAVAGTSTVSGTGNYSLNYGDNTIQITCISQSGDSRTYTLIVARAGGSAGGTIQVADDAAITPFYPIGTYVTGIEPGTSASTVASGIGTQNCTVKILNADGSENTQTVGTGNKLAVYVGDTLVQQYEIVVYGDINGDGKVSNLDLVLMQKQILGIESQSGSRLEAANVSKDGGISNKDLVILQKHILGISQIDQ